MVGGIAHPIESLAIGVVGAGWNQRARSVRFTRRFHPDKGMIVGWCNVNEKSVYPRLKNLIDNDEDVISIACFLVQKDFRGKGIAQKILEKIIVDAKASNKKIVEAYPRRLSRTDYGKWHGSYSMYLKNGFRIENIGKVEVARLYLLA